MVISCISRKSINTCLNKMLKLWHVKYVFPLWDCTTARECKSRNHPSYLFPGTCIVVYLVKVIERQSLREEAQNLFLAFLSLINGIGSLSAKPLHLQRSLRESIDEPMIVMSDFAKFERPSQLHVLFRALEAWRAAHGQRLPRPWNREDSVAFHSFAKSFNDGLPESCRTELPEKLSRVFAHTCAGNVSPMQVSCKCCVFTSSMKRTTPLWEMHGSEFSLHILVTGFASWRRILALYTVLGKNISFKNWYQSLWFTYVVFINLSGI